jgi:hypothetical protein
LTVAGLWAGGVVVVVMVYIVSRKNEENENIKNSATRAAILMKDGMCPPIDGYWGPGGWCKKEGG